MTTPRHDAALLFARILLTLLFIVAGIGKITAFGQTVGYMGAVGLPMPEIATAGVIAIELGLGAALLAGAFTVPVALVLAVYTVMTAVLGHHFWTMTDPARTANMVHFLKNLSIAGGFILLSVTGPGRYSVDRLLKRA